MTEVSIAPPPSTDRFKGAGFRGDLSGRRASRIGNPADRKPTYQAKEGPKPVEPEHAKPITPEAPSAAKGSTREKVAQALKKAIFTPSPESEASDVQELLEAAQAELSKLQTAIKDKVVAEERGVLMNKLSLSPPLEQKDEDAISQLLSDSQTQKDIEAEVQKQFDKQKGEREVNAKAARQKELAEQRESKNKNLQRLASADGKGMIQKEKLNAQGDVVVDPYGQPIMDSEPVNDQILKALQEMPNQKDLATEFENLLVDEPVLEAVKSHLSETLRGEPKNPDTQSGRLAILQALYENDASPEGKNILAAYMYQELQDVQGSQATRDFVAKASGNETVLNGRLDALLTKYGGELGAKNVNRKNIVKCLVLASIAQDKAPSFITRDENGLAFSTLGNQVINSPTWGISRSEKEFVLGLLKNADLSTASRDFHLPVSGLTDKDAVKHLAENAVNAIFPDANKKQKAAFIDHAAFHMGLWAEDEKYNSKEKSAFLGGIGPILLTMLLSAEGLLKSGVEEGGGQSRGH